MSRSIFVALCWFNLLVWILPALAAVFFCEKIILAWWILSGCASIITAMIFNDCEFKIRD